MRKLLGVVVGVVTLGITVTIVEAIGHGIFPPPSGTDVTDPAQLAALMQSVPTGAKIMVVVGWFLGALVGAWTALAIARWTSAPWIVVAIAIILGVITLFMIPHPLWMQAAALVAPLIGGWIAARFPPATLS